MYRFYRFKNALEDNRGVTTIEMIMILVALVGLVLLFRSGLTDIMNSVLDLVRSRISAL